MALYSRKLYDNYAVANRRLGLIARPAVVAGRGGGSGAGIPLGSTGPIVGRKDECLVVKLLHGKLLIYVRP